MAKITYITSDNKIHDCALPSTIQIEETPPLEAKQMAMDIDYQKRKADPNYKGAFHEKKKKKPSTNKKSNRRSSI